MANKLKNFSTSPGSNNAAPPYGWPEGMPPSAVNDTARQDRASLREWYEDAEWRDLGHTVSAISGSTITIPGSYGAVYAIGQAIRINGSLVGTINNVTISNGNTLLDVDGFTIPATITQIECGIITTTVRGLNRGASYATFGSAATGLPLNVVVNGAQAATIAQAAASFPQALSSENSVHGNSYLSLGPSTTSDLYYKIATLPASSSGTYDALCVEALASAGWSNPTKLTIVLSNRNGFNYRWKSDGHIPAGVGIRCYQDSANGPISVYAWLQAGTYNHISPTVLNAVVGQSGTQNGAIIFPVPALVASPVGTLVFDSAAPNTYKPLFAAGTDGASVGAVGTSMLIPNGLTVNGAATLSGATSLNGPLTIGGSSSCYNISSAGEKYRLINDGSFISFFASDNTTRRGYLQGNAANVTLSAETGDLLLFGSTAIKMLNALWTAPNTVAVGGTTQASFRVYAAAGNPAAMTFERTGQYAINVGLDTDNVFRIGGYTDGANTYRLSLDSAGNASVRGALTAASATIANGLTVSGGTLACPNNTVAVGGNQTSTTINGAANQPAAVTFQRANQYAVNLGLDTDNVFRLGGYSDGANTYRLTVDASGNFATRGAISAPSAIFGTGGLTLSGSVFSSAAAAEKYRLINDGSYISFFASDNTTRRGYLQGNSGDITLASDSGNLLLNCPGVVTLGGQLRTNPNTIAVGGTTQAQARIFANAGNPAVMTFERSGQYAVNMGLDTDNVFRVGGYTDGANTYRLTLDTAGNAVARGSVTAASLSTAGQLTMTGAGTSEKIRWVGDGSYLSSFASDNTTRRGYLQFNAANVTLAAENGELDLSGGTVKLIGTNNLVQLTSTQMFLQANGSSGVAITATAGAAGIGGQTLLNLSTAGTVRQQYDSAGNLQSWVAGAGVLMPDYSARAWVNFQGANGTIQKAGNVTSVTRNATGVYTVNFIAAMPDAFYAVSGGGQSSTTTDRGAFFSGVQGTGQTPSSYSTTQATVSFTGINQAGNSSGAVDPVFATLAFHR